MTGNNGHRTGVQPVEHNDERRRRLEEAEQTLEAIRCSDGDALVVTGSQGEQLYSLAGAEHVYRAIVETMNEAALTVDSDGTILFCNRRFCDLMKTPIQGAMGHKLTAFVAPPQHVPLTMLLADARVGPVQRCLTLRAADGTLVPFQLSARPLEADDRPSICLVASDLTELDASAHSVCVVREYQQALEESEHRYRELVRCTPAAIYTVDVRSQRLTSVNDTMCQVSGYSREELFTMNPFDLLEGHSRTHFQMRIRQWLEEGLTPDKSVEYQMKTKDGRILDVLLHTAFSADRNGKPLRVTVVAHDITERKHAEERLHELTATLESKVAQRTAELEDRARQLQSLTLELSQAEEWERRRIALFLHEDLQQDIVGAKLHLNLVRGRAEDDRLRADIDRVDDMLKEAIEKSRSLSHDLSPAVLHLNDLAEVLQWLANRVRTQHGLTVHIDTLDETTLPSEAMTMFLFRAAQEILFNVVKHAGVKKAALRLRRKRRHVCLYVFDHGCGFDPEELPKTPGFGLRGIRERVELLGGRMRIKSARNRGTAVGIIVPDGHVQTDRRFS